MIELSLQSEKYFLLSLMVALLQLGLCAMKRQLDLYYEGTGCAAGSRLQEEIPEPKERSVGE